MELSNLTNASTSFELLSYVYYTFTPFLILILLMTIASNMINIIMIAKTMKQCTSLNIALLNISIFNFLLAFNQAALLALILQRGAHIPKEVCHLALMINTTSSLGISFVHLFLAWDRYKIAITPSCWLQNRRLAWIYTTILWIGVVIVAVYNFMFQFEDITGDIYRCFSASPSCHFAYGIALQLLYLAVLIGLSVLIYTLHAKTASILKWNEKANTLQLEQNSGVSVDRPKKKTSPEKAIDSILKVQTLHLTTQAPIYIYNMLEHAFATQSLLPMIILITISFITAISPLFMLLNNRYKQNIKLFFSWISNKKNKAPYFPQDSKATNMLNSEPKLHPNDRAIFFSISNERANQYSIPKKAERNYKPRPQRGSINGRNNPSVTTAALKAGLVLSAAGHQIQLNNFFKEDNGTWLQEMYGEDLETIF